MSIITGESTKTTESTAPPTASGSPQVLITEQEVLAGTAAARGLRSKGSPRWITALTRIFTTSAVDRRPRAHADVSRAAYLEGPRMAREMERL